MSLLETIHQSLIFRDQLWASLSSARLVFKQPLHQLGEVFHDFLQGWSRFVDKNDSDSQGGKLFKSEQSFKGAAALD